MRTIRPVRPTVALAATLEGPAMHVQTLAGAIESLNEALVAAG